MSEFADVKTLRSQVRRAGGWVLGTFWFVQFCEMTGIVYMANPRSDSLYVLPRIGLVCIGILLTVGLLEVINHFLDKPFRVRLAIALGSALATCALQSIANYLIFYVLLSPVDTDAGTAATFFWLSFSWTWFFISVAGAILALSYSFDVRNQQRQLADLRIVAQSAQLRALRYQLNPHFLFNTLNSIAALIAQRSNDTAEQMIENLSDFLRASLELDAGEDVPLDREIELQSLYLGIEILRFPSRLRIDIRVPPELRSAVVPSLITQPLIENVIKYAVARSTRPVTLEIAAVAEGGNLKLRISDDGSDDLQTAKICSGTGVGLANVASRLRTRFGDNQYVRTTRNEAGGFDVELSLPLRFAA